jgi:outer membrane receptor for monomeric catechols
MAFSFSKYFSISTSTSISTKSSSIYLFIISIITVFNSPTNSYAQNNENNHTINEAQTQFQTFQTIEVSGKKQQYSNIDIGINSETQNKNPILNITKVNNKKIANIQATTLADVAKLDSSLNQNYAPIGYQENFSLRGLPLNLDASYLLNGIPSSHRQIPNLANKEQIEIIKGVDALGSVNGSAGGAVNYITKKAKDIKQVNTYAQGSGEYGFGLDVGKIYNDNFGYRVNLDYAKLKPYVKLATGEKYLASIALSGKQNKLSWQLDADYQYHRQYSVPGYQLLGGTDIPQNVEAETMLHNLEY